MLFDDGLVDLVSDGILVEFSFSTNFSVLLELREFNPSLDYDDCVELTRISSFCGSFLVLIESRIL